MHFSKSTLAAALAAAHLALAQTYTDCNPTEKTCPNDTGLPASTFSTDFTKGSSSFTSWSAAAGTTITYDDNGAAFTIAKAGQAPTIQTDFYIFFGKIEVVMQASPGQGIVSSIVLESDDLDEIDWEWLGGDTTEVETNYFGKGNTTTYDRAIYYPVSSPQTTFHTYTIDWTSSAINFMIDGATVRTINYADCNGGSNYPQTPMRLKLGNWAGGAAGESAGTVEWAGGATDFSQAPFTMYVKSVSVENYNPAKAYKWTDETGSFESIQLVKSDGSSASAGTSSSVASRTASASSDSRTNAPTSMVSVKHSSPTSTKHSEGSSMTTSVSSGSSSSATGSSSSSGSASSASSTSSGSSASANSTASSTSASASPPQTTNGAASRGVARALIALSSIAFGIMLL
ncbi:concanavalin A-like lectin/glucanase domain-containing protein [Delphinella strobiligena]|nr:concanavalin A-like lectin/glucanase domain-containing protein [Delphinella strobiligena]